MMIIKPSSAMSPAELDAQYEGGVQLTVTPETQFREEEIGMADRIEDMDNELAMEELSGDTQQIKAVQAQRDAASPGAVALREMDEELAREAAAENAEATKVAFESSPLADPSAPLNPDNYDFEAAHAAGEPFTPDETGAVPMKIAHVKPGKMLIGGRDISDGHQVVSTGLSPENDAWVTAGITSLQKSTVNANGAEDINTDVAAAQIAHGFLQGGRDFKDYEASLRGPLVNEKQIRRGGIAAEIVRDRKDLATSITKNTVTAVQNIMSRPEAMRQAQADLDKPRDINTAELPTNPEWLGNGGHLYELMEGKPFEGSDSELSEWVLETMVYTNHNTLYTAYVATSLATGSPDQGKAFLNLLDMYDQVDLDWGIVADAAGAQLLDPLNYAGIGLEYKLVSMAAKGAKRAMFKAIIPSMIVGGLEGGAVAGFESDRDQEAMVTAGYQAEKDTGKIATDAAVGVGVGAVLGGTIGGIGEKATPMILKGTDYMKQQADPLFDALQEFGSNVEGSVPIPAALMPKQQRGIFTNEPAEFTKAIETLAAADPKMAASEIKLMQDDFKRMNTKERSAIKRNGMAPYLLSISDTLPEKPLKITGDVKETMNLTLAENAQIQQERLDLIHTKHPNPLESPEAWARFQGDVYGTGSGLVAPNNLIKNMNDIEGWAEKHAALSPLQLEHVDAGFKLIGRIGNKYKAGKAKVTDTGALYMWSFLSRGIDPFAQEGMFLKAYKDAKPYIQAASEGKFDEKMLKKYLKWSGKASAAGSGEAGSGATANLNSFGEDFLLKMGKIGEDGETPMKKLHDMMMDQDMPSKQIRRKFFELAKGVGIDNKVVSFTLLAAGRHDVMILDRVQLRNLFDDGRFSDINLYDNVKEAKVKGGGKPKSIGGTGMADFTYGYRGLSVYEAVEEAMIEKLPELYKALGREGDASIGRYHWESWVLKSEQEVSHPTLEAIAKGLEGSDDPFGGVRIRHGAYDKFAYGVEYGVNENGQSRYFYKTSTGDEYMFTPSEWSDFTKEMKKPKSGVVPKGFKVGDHTSKSWRESPDVDQEALDTLIAERGKPM